MELDLYGGVTGEFNDFGYDVGLLRYFYPSGSINNTTEWHAGGSWKWLGATVYYSKDWFGTDDSAGRFEGTFDYDLPYEIGLSASVANNYGDGVEAFFDMRQGLRDCDIVMMLRLQTERMQGSYVPSVREYFRFFGLDRDKLQAASLGAAQDQVGRLVEVAEDVNGAKVATGLIEVADSETLRAFGDSLRERLGTGVGVVAARMGERHALLAVVTDDLIGKGMRADAVVREVAKLAGDKGGGRPHMAQASTGDPARAEAALEKVAEIVRPMLEQAGV